VASPSIDRGLPGPGSRPAAGSAPVYYRIITPEGVPLLFEVATAGDRMAAFFLDLMLIVSGAVVVLIVLIFAFVTRESVAAALALFVGFLLRYFYFTFFELRGMGRTFGKRRLGLRVVARDGGPLTAEMIFARNLMRDLEFFLPLLVLLAPEALIPEGRGLGTLIGLCWLFVFALMPLFGKYRLRCGDLIAGTLVVRDPRGTLLRDLAEKRVLPKSKAPPEEIGTGFTTEELEVYGIRELQVLEDLFRRFEDQRASREVLEEVAKRIRKKIGRPEDDAGADALKFLRDFYKAQRAHLEKKLLFGQRKERKSGGGKR
jgi:uncharacterized RDD family membrane protein YckC